MGRQIIFGEIDGIEEGHFFQNRREMMLNSFHRMWAAGIDSDKFSGVAAIVLSGGYEDDLDLGDEIVYTGAGGNDSNTRKQIEDQTWENRANAGMRISMDKELPIRVIRGSKHKSDFSPSIGYQYAGLYHIVDAWEEKGKSGYIVCRFKLAYCGNNIERVTSVNFSIVKRLLQNKTQRKESIILRIVRDTKMTREIKSIYNCSCQVCGEAIPTKSGKYAEGAHIRPLGNPHNGYDVSDNLICLCPNHHIMFDKGAFSIADDLQLIGAVSGKIVLNPQHFLDRKNLQYHRKYHGFN